jgi:hypothetical protein
MAGIETLSLFVNYGLKNLYSTCTWWVLSLNGKD